jgi:hypothetical protein
VRLEHLLSGEKQSRMLLTEEKWSADIRLVNTSLKY